MNITPEAINLTTAAAAALVKAIPKSKLAQVGLSKTPFIGALPVAAAIAGGAVVTALVIPQSRQWMLDKGRSVYDGWIKSSEQPEPGDLREAANQGAADSAQQPAA